MEPRNDRRQDDLALGIALSNIRNPLTVATLTAQILRRRIEQGQIREAHQCLSALARIEASGQTMRSSLEALDSFIADQRSENPE